MSQLERLKQEVKTLLTDIEYLERVNLKKESESYHYHFVAYLLGFLLLVTNSAWYAVFLGT